jgi:hypothetical protein
MDCVPQPLASIRTIPLCVCDTNAESASVAGAVAGRVGVGDGVAGAVLVTVCTVTWVAPPQPARARARAPNAAAQATTRSLLNTCNNGPADRGLACRSPRGQPAYGGTRLNQARHRNDVRSAWRAFLRTLRTFAP